MNEENNIKPEEKKNNNWSFSEFAKEFSFFTFTFTVLIIIFIGYADKHIAIQQQKAQAETYMAINQCTDSYYEINYVQVEDRYLFEQDVVRALIVTFNGTNENLEKVKKFEDGLTILDEFTLKQIVYETLRDYCSLEYTEMRFNELQNSYKENLGFRLYDIFTTAVDLVEGFGRDIVKIFQ